MLTVDRRSPHAGPRDWLLGALPKVRNGSLESSAALLRDGLAMWPESDCLLLALARILERMGSIEEALGTYRRLLILGCDSTATCLGLARSLSLAGSEAEAAWHYAMAVQRLRTSGQIMSHVDLRKEVEEAYGYIYPRLGLIFGKLLDDVRAAHGNCELGRIEQCIDIYLGRGFPDFGHPLQRPELLYVPDLPCIPFFDRRSLDFVHALESATRDITREYSTFAQRALPTETVIRDEALRRSSVNGGGAPEGRWTGIYLWRFGEEVARSREHFPITCATLDSLPLAKVKGNGPEVMFSILAPGCHILPHRGATNARAVCHLPLVVPEKCFLRVGGRAHAWEQGRVVVFDDTFLHEAVNRSSEPRIVLICDVWNPFLSHEERKALSVIIEFMGFLAPSRA